MAKSKSDAIAAVLDKLPQDDLSVLARLERANKDVLGYGYDITFHDGNYFVSKLSTSLLEDNSNTYIVDNVSCTCPDFEKARGNLCKHRLAIMILEEMQLG
jgi:predicted nucleic acid-binding Zn finger protein